MILSRLDLILIISCFLVLIFFLNIYSIRIAQKYTRKHLAQKQLIFDELTQGKLYTRDFQRYVCKNQVRVGGFKDFIWNANNTKTRIDNAWFICFDEFSQPRRDDCLVFSFGLIDDDSFDASLNADYGCTVLSFDPFYENKRFTKLRESNPALNKSLFVPFNDKWSFYKLGVGIAMNIPNFNDIKMGDILSFDQILNYTNSKNKIIDVLKIDIDGRERDVFANLDVDYLCHYVKQFHLETYPSFVDIVIERLMLLEKCFYLYYRSTRFFTGDTWGPTGHVTEFHNANGYLLQINRFVDEVDLAKWLFSMGELSFVNINFIEAIV